MHVAVVVIVVLRFNLMISANHSTDVSQAIIEKQPLIFRFNSTFYSEIFEQH